MIEALADRADAGARKVIADHVLASDSAVQLAAIEASGRLGNGSSVSLLSGVLAGTGTAKAGAAAERALVELKGGQATDQAIIRELQRASASLKPRFISVLARRGSSTALPVLLEESRSANATVAKASCQALGRLAGEKEAPILVDYLSKLADADIRDDAEAAAIQVLNRIPAPSARSELVCPKLGQTTDPAQRASLIRLLLACGDARAIKTLEPECDSPATLVRNAAVRTLADWPTLAAWNPLMRYYRQDRDESYRVLALRGLVRLAGEENPRPDLAQVDRYRQLLAAAKGNGDRKLILGAMAGCSHPEALRLALPLLAQPAVRAEAASAVKTLAESLKPQHPQLAADALKQLSNENF